MMLINGTLSGVRPPNFTNRHGVQYQDIQITNVQGQKIVGQIGCKAPYTEQNIGEQGQWDLEQATNSKGNPYNKLKKHYDTPYGSGQSFSQNAQQGVSHPAGANKDRLIVAQVVYKELAGMSQDLGDFDTWLMGDGKNVLKRHVDLIMQVGKGEQLRHQTEPDAPEPPDDDIPF